MSSRLPGIIFIVFAIAVVAGIGYYAISSIGNYEISQENARIAAITTVPTPYPTIVPQTREIKLTAAAPVTTTQVQEVVTARQVLAPLKNTLTLSSGSGTNTERFDAQAKGKVSITITHTAPTQIHPEKCYENNPKWVLAGTTINDITLDNQETSKTSPAMIVTLPVPGQYSITGFSCYDWTAIISNA